MASHDVFKGNGFSYFLAEKKASKPIFAKLTFQEAMKRFDPEWRTLPESKKYEYKVKAKETKRLGLPGPLPAEDSKKEKPRPVKDRGNPEDVEKMVVESVKKFLSEGCLKTMTFLVMEVISWLEPHQAHAATGIAPAEISILEMNLSEGIVRQRHWVVHYGEIPLGFMRDAQQRVERVHKLELDMGEILDSDYCSIFQELTNFITEAQHNPEYIFRGRPDLHKKFLFVQSKCRREINQGLDWLSFKNKEDPDAFKILPLATLLSGIISEGLDSVYKPTTSDILENNTWFFYDKGLKCTVHEDAGDCDNYSCALGRAKINAFRIFKILCPHMGIRMLPGKHKPA